MTKGGSKATSIIIDEALSSALVTQIHDSTRQPRTQMSVNDHTMQESLATTDQPLFLEYSRTSFSCVRHYHSPQYV